MLPKQLESLFGTVKGCLAIWDWITLYNFQRNVSDRRQTNLRLISIQKIWLFVPHPEQFDEFGIDVRRLINFITLKKSFES